MLRTRFIPRRLIGSIPTPFVHVDAIEISGCSGRSTGKIFGFGFTSDGIVVGAVTDGDGAVVFGGDVGFCVADGSLNKCACLRVREVVGHFVAGEEAENIGILGKDVNNTLVACKGIDGPFRVATVDIGRVSGRGQVGNNIDSCMYIRKGVLKNGKLIPALAKAVRHAEWSLDVSMA